MDSGSKNTWDFAQLLEHIDVGILVLDLDRRVIDYCNAAFYDVVRDEALCRDYQALFDLFIETGDQDAGGPANQAGRKLSRHGRLFGYSVYRADRRYRCVLIRDITEKSRLESIAQAVNATDNLGFIFSGIRHEIGNPLNSLKMALSVLKDTVDSASTDKIKEYLERGLADVGRMEYLLKSLKAFSLYEKVDLREMALVEFVDRFISLVERDFRSRGIRITTDIPVARVRIDQRALHQALLNIFNNAADALLGRDAAEIGVAAEIRGQLVWLTIEDNGCGIAPDRQKHLFQPFNSSKEHGNGLGLVITRKLLAMMDSDIAVSSRPDVGTRVTVRLPIATEASLAMR